MGFFFFLNNSKGQMALTLFSRNWDKSSRTGLPNGEVQIGTAEGFEGRFDLLLQQFGKVNVSKPRVGLDLLYSKSLFDVTI